MGDTQAFDLSAMGSAIADSPDPSAPTGKSGKKKKKTPAQIEAALTERLSHLPASPRTPLEPKNTFNLQPFFLLSPVYRPALETFLTPSCLANPTLFTPRLKLRPVRESDTDAIGRIKRDPSVTKTQLYNAPSDMELREAFVNRYVRANIPRAPSGRFTENNGKVREDYIFAITIKEVADVKLGSAAGVRLQSRITDTTGYVGNIALHCTASPYARLLPRAHKVYTLPTFDQTTSAELTGTLFYELHPQLWGQGIMREAFREVVRFAIEELGCAVVLSDPMQGNTASISLCTSAGFRYSHTTKENAFNRMQVVYKLSRKEWWAKNKPAGQATKGKYEGHLGCRWCLVSLEAAQVELGMDKPKDPAHSASPDDDPPTPTLESKPRPASQAIERCSGCEWAAYCSRECRLADLSAQGGHQTYCGEAKS